MIYPEPHVNEALRLQSLDSYTILDSQPEHAYDNITALAAEIAGTPISLISLIDEKRQWFKSNHGLEVRETPREYAFCAHAINCTDDIFVVSNSRTDPRFMNNPLVEGNPHVIFYAGVPFYDDNDLPLGTLCIIDNKPRHLSEHEIKSLKSLANQVMILLKNRKLTAELTQSIIKLSKKNKDLEQLAYLMAHDLKSPLINISSISKHLSSYYSHELDNDGRTLVSLINRSSDKLKDFIDDVLNYYKDENQIQEKSSTIDLIEFYNQIVELFNHNHSIAFELKTSLNHITLNETVLYQIMVNLISNAIRYNDKNNIAIEIGVIENLGFYEFYVQDNGPGISEHLHEKVFELFIVGNKLDKAGKKGNGIGLATVKKLIERYGGTIELENCKKYGCKFTFQLNKQ